MREATSHKGELAHPCGDCRDPSERSGDGCTKQLCAHCEKNNNLFDEICVIVKKISKGLYGEVFMIYNNIDDEPEQVQALF